MLLVPRERQLAVNEGDIIQINTSYSIRSHSGVNTAILNLIAVFQKYLSKIIPHSSLPVGRVFSPFMHRLYQAGSNT